MLNEPGGAGFYGAHGFNGNIQVAQNHGFRAFRFAADDSLRSLVYDYQWTDGINRAVCARTTTWNKPAAPCPFPNKRCSHGFYAYYDEDYYPVSFDGNTIIVSGVIDGFGRCVIGEKGYRSEYARLVALVSPLRYSRSVLSDMKLTSQALEERVNSTMERLFPTVPIFDSVEELRKVIPLPGRPPRNAE